MAETLVEFLQELEDKIENADSTQNLVTIYMSAEQAELLAAAIRLKV